MRPLTGLAPLAALIALLGFALLFLGYGPGDLWYIPLP